MPDDLMPLFQHPPLPDEWDYDASVEKMKRLIYKWKNMTRDMANELWIAKETLKAQGWRTDLTSPQMRRSWIDYCDDIGINKATVDRWLTRWFPESLALENKPIVELAECTEWISRQEECDLLLTDPPYSTDIEDIHTFIKSWLPLALDRVKSTGRAYVCIGAYPEEIEAYIEASKHIPLRLMNILVWTYDNTLGPSPTHDYKLNWQAVLYYRGHDASPLKCPQMMEQMTVQRIAAPDGRQGDRYHEFQKPLELADRLIKHSTNEGDLVLDCFVGTGTFVLAANRIGRVGRGCDIDRIAVDIAVKRGCRVSALDD